MWSPRRVRVSVPATSANLGPGFDSLGMALSLYDEVTAEVPADAPAGLVEVHVEGEGAGTVPTDASHLVVRAMLACFGAMQLPPPPLRLACRNVVPHSRGLGSSAAAIVAGVVLARALVVDGVERLDDAGVLGLAADLEGHPDNVAPALLGGFTISGRDEAGRWYAVPSPLSPHLRAVAMVPPDPVSTEVARGLLPATVPHAEAAANSGRTALLVAALAQRVELLHEATRDWLHQQQREPAMPATLAQVRDLRARGVAATVSGAGPTVLALGGEDLDDLVGPAPQGWARHVLRPDTAGARLQVLDD
ncbi:homoserine kinase [Nocardioidaceae bacterium]|nr:homoserine kinase [Nocardioidaceae bacterium]